VTTLERRLGLGDAVIVGLAAMVGAGVFAAFGPAARAAGGWLSAALLLAAGVAWCNATSSARLAARYPASGGTYVYGRERLGPFWGYLAGWCFVVGKTASCAAMALTVGAYAWPAHAHLVAVLAVAAVVAIDCAGVEKSARASRLIVGCVLAVLLLFVAVALASPRPGGPDAREAAGAASPYGVLQAAGLLFFAFAGYARLATLGEEVREPERTIPRAIPVALGIALAVYAGVAAALWWLLGPGGLAEAGSPLADAAAVSRWPGLGAVLRATAVVAAFGSLLSLLLGVSRTAFAMARDGHLPEVLAEVSARTRVPHRAALAVGLVAGLVSAVADVRAAIGFSSVAVLTYYAIANAAASTLRADEGPPARGVPWLGLAGCLVLAATLPWASVVGGLALIAAGATAYAVRRRG
jgi:APA family basic amino acid/polyamine antiporter